MFLEPRSYRRRRLIDTLRILPVCGLVLFLMPLIWPSTPQDGVPLSLRGVYLYGVWFALVILTGVLSARLHAQMHERAPDPRSPGSAAQPLRPAPRGLDEDAGADGL